MWIMLSLCTSHKSHSVPDNTFAVNMKLCDGHTIFVAVYTWTSMHLLHAFLSVFMCTCVCMAGCIEVCYFCVGCAHPQVCVHCRHSGHQGQ